MIKFTTKNGTRNGLPEITSFIIDDNNRWAMSNVFSFLDRQIAAGVVFHPGETIQIGYSEVIIRSSIDHTLELFEPDYLSFPLVYKAGLDKTIELIEMQDEVVRSLPELIYQQSNCPSIMRSIIVCSEFENNNHRVIMKRESASGNDSGWAIGCSSAHDHNDPRNLSRESVYYVLIKRYTLGAFLSLPVGCGVLYTPGRELMIHDANYDPYLISQDSPLRWRFPFAS